MSTWNKAHIKYQYSPENDRNHRSIDSMTLNVYGKSESAALQQLRKTHPSRTDFVILELEWED